MAVENWITIKDNRYGGEKIIRSRLWDILKKKTYNGKPQYTLISTSTEEIPEEKKKGVAGSVGVNPLIPTPASAPVPDDVIIKHIGSARTQMALDRIKSKLTEDQLVKFGPALEAKSAEINPSAPTEPEAAPKSAAKQSKPKAKKA